MEWTLSLLMSILAALPVIMIPMIAADPFRPGVTNTLNTAEFLGSVVSLSTLGTGIGKIVNGFVCQLIGGKASASIYLLGVALFSVILSTTYTIHGYGTYSHYFDKKVFKFDFNSSPFYSYCWDGILCEYDVDRVFCFNG